MSEPKSEHFKVQAIPGAGRGVVASRSVGKDALLLKSPEPAAHVVFRQYRKEVCAQCFFYDRGRTLPVRDNVVGKVFCSEECRSVWRLEQGESGLVAWTELENYTKANAKAIINVYALESTGDKPSEAVILSTWASAEALLSPNDAQNPASTIHTTNNRPHPRQPAKHKPRHWTRMDPSLFSYLLSGAISNHNHGPSYRELIAPLAKDPQPYKSQAELEVHSETFLYLHAILPSPLKITFTADLCRALIDAGSHNSFGLRSGGEDAEEYMGYALYPSASYFNHSCKPNVSKRRVRREWEFRAARAVEPGEELCITYLGGDERDLSVEDRRSRLAEVWGFTCMCQRCIEEAP
ncbi:SET domain-containing protein [Polychaeton citri CBS 116435]|uniref:SET domain-containing protein n=1 Tax=Polychaeton citri CBS 116435 TaxID=1314669 RepID=A0A9P4QBG6_9PEZI|nr:SET domain-containing protein [Polychaeton citri CBS 116435]